tara:strand:+ start:630 stop:1454 length:825 start_codon:yes stop_codon:yes gene_type:complete
MREWRKLYSSIVNSEQVAQLSDGAFVLFTLLIVAQDDKGLYPWEPTKIKSLVVGRRGWTVGRAEKHKDELLAAGLCRIDAAFLVLIKGEKKNGTPRNDRRPLFYNTGDPLSEPERHTTGMSVDDQRSATDGTKRRVEERRVRGDKSREDVQSAQPGASGGSFQEWLERVGSNGNKAAALSRMATGLTGKDVAASRMAGLLKNTYSGDHGYLALCIWNAAAAAPAGDFLSYLQGMKRQGNQRGPARGQGHDAEAWAEEARRADEVRRKTALQRGE